MPVPAVGDRVKVVERATSADTKVVSEGTVAAVDETNNRLDFEGFGRTKLVDTAGVNVRIEVLMPPLPTTVGSVVRVGATGETHFLTSTGWVSSLAGNPIRLGALQGSAYEIVLNAEATD